MRMADYGDPVRGVHCPQCGFETVVYNGNYFCSDPACGWAMPDRYTATGRKRRGKRVEQENLIVRTYLLQRRKEAEDKGDVKEVERMDLYLKDVR